jgi:protein tyrosine phosphatase (PTP) superfamily phosphohydrolase (DUF442 family)
LEPLLVASTWLDSVHLPSPDQPWPVDRSNGQVAFLAVDSSHREVARGEGLCSVPLKGGRDHLREDDGTREKLTMFNLQWLRDRGVNRGKPNPLGGRGRRLLVLGLLIGSSVLETGCQSSRFCGPCGIVGRTTSLIRRPFQALRGGEPVVYGSEVISDGGCISSGVPIESMGGPVIGPAAPIGSGVTPSNVAPSDLPESLEAIPKADPGPAPSSSVRKLPSSTGSRGGLNGEASRSVSTPAGPRGDNLASSLLSKPESPARSSRNSSAAQDDASVLDHLPPLDLPSEVTEKSISPPVAPAAERKPQAPASDHVSGRSQAIDDPSRKIEAAALPDPASPAGEVPGITRFSAVDSRLAGGSTPTAAGLDWLQEKGYKTLVDLREPSETNAAFIDEVSRRGLRYIALPLSRTSLSRTHLDRFNTELAYADARPLFFFDTDGARAGLLWYLRRVTLDRVSPQIAHDEASDLGLTNREDWLTAANFLEQLEKARATSASPMPGPAAPSAEKGQNVGASPFKNYYR